MTTRKMVEEKIAKLHEMREEICSKDIVVGRISLFGIRYQLMAHSGTYYVQREIKKKGKKAFVFVKNEFEYRYVFRCFKKHFVLDPQINVAFKTSDINHKTEIVFYIFALAVFLLGVSLRIRFRRDITFKAALVPEIIQIIVLYIVLTFTLFVFKGYRDKITKLFSKYAYVIAGILYIFGMIYWICIKKPANPVDTSIEHFILTTAIIPIIYTQRNKGLKGFAIVISSAIFIVGTVYLIEEFVVPGEYNRYIILACVLLVITIVLQKRRWYGYKIDGTLLFWTYIVILIGLLIWANFDWITGVFIPDKAYTIESSFASTSRAIMREASLFRGAYSYSEDIYGKLASSIFIQFRECFLLIHLLDQYGWFITILSLIPIVGLLVSGYVVCFKRKGMPFYISFTALTFLSAITFIYLGQNFGFFLIKIGNMPLFSSMITENIAVIFMIVMIGDPSIDCEVNTWESFSEKDHRDLEWKYYESGNSVVTQHIRINAASMKSLLENCFDQHVYSDLSEFSEIIDSNRDYFYVSITGDYMSIINYISNMNMRYNKLVAYRFSYGAKDIEIIPYLMYDEIEKSFDVDIEGIEGFICRKENVDEHFCRISFLI